MDDGGRRCALPGCGVEIRSVSGRPERRYCSAAHRLAARAARRAATQARQRVAAGGDLSATLPWLRDPAAPTPRDPYVRSTGPVLRPVVRKPVDGAASGSVGSGAAGSRAAESRAAEPGLVARAAAGRSPASRRDDARPRRRALVVIGVAGILAGGGYAATAGPEPAVPAQATPDGRIDGESGDAWASRATVALAAVNTQLDTLARADEQWRRLPESRSGVVPAPVAALIERRSVLERRRATLQSQLDAYRSLRETQQDLADSEQSLKAVEKVLAAPQDRPGAEQEAAIAALDEQRDLRIQRRDAQRAEVRGLEDDVSTAARTPLPDDGAATDEVSRGVLEVVRNGGREPQRRDETRPPRSDVVPGREPEDATRRQEPATSGTPGPRESRDAGEEQPDVPSSSPSSMPSPSLLPSSPKAPEADVVAQLHEQARRAAREARRAEAERQAEQRAAEKSSEKPAEKKDGKDRPEREPDARPTRHDAGGPQRGTGSEATADGAVAGRSAPGRHRAPDNLQVTRITIRVGPGRHAAADRPAASSGDERGRRGRGEEAGKAATKAGERAARPAVDMDDDAIEERNAERAARSTWKPAKDRAASP